MNLSDIGWAWFAIGVILGFLAGAMYGVRKQLAAKLKYLDNKPRVDRIPLAESSFFDGETHWEEPGMGRVVRDRGMKELG